MISGGSNRSIRRSSITSAIWSGCSAVRVSIATAVISGGSYRSIRRSDITSGAGGVSGY